MSNTPMLKLFILLIRLVLGMIFIYAGITKVLNPAAFAEDIDNYQMLPYILVNVAAIVLPWIEIIAGLLIVFGRYLTVSSFIIIFLNVIFIFAIASAMARGLDINCGCFSVADHGSKVGWQRLVEDFVFLGMAVTVFWDSLRKLKSR